MQITKTKTRKLYVDVNVADHELIIAEDVGRGLEWIHDIVGVSPREFTKIVLFVIRARGLDVKQMADICRGCQGRG